MKNKKIYVLLACLAVMLAGCGVNMAEKTNIQKIKNEPVVNNTATSSERKAATAIDTTDWLEYNSEYFLEKFIYPNNLVYFEFGDGRGLVVTFYDKEEFEENNCNNNETGIFPCWHSSLAIFSISEFYYEDEQEKKMIQESELNDIFSKAEKIKINNYNAYLISGDVEEIDKSSSSRDFYKSKNIIRAYISDYKNRLIKITMTLSGQYNEEVFRAIIDRLIFKQVLGSGLYL